MHVELELPKCDIWLGEFPLLQKEGFESVLSFFFLGLIDCTKIEKK